MKKSPKCFDVTRLRDLFFSNFLAFLRKSKLKLNQSQSHDPKEHSEALKVRKSRKQIMVSSILPKNKRWDNFHYIKLSQRSFFGRIEDIVIFFRDLLTYKDISRFSILTKEPEISLVYGSWGPSC